MCNYFVQIQGISEADELNTEVINLALLCLFLIQLGYNKQGPMYSRALDFASIRTHCIVNMIFWAGWIALD